MTMVRLSCVLYVAHVAATRHFMLVRQLKSEPNSASSTSSDEDMIFLRRGLGGNLGLLFRKEAFCGFGGLFECFRIECDDEHAGFFEDWLATKLYLRSR